jgi:DNA-binding response OmpR family regulator
LVRIMKGTIELSDNPSQNGCMFTVRFPVDKSSFGLGEITNRGVDIDVACEEIAIAEDTLMQSEINNLTYPIDLKKQGQSLVLIVEDDYDVRKFIANSLADRFRILEAANGNSALDLAKDEMPDLIISDVMMPGIDGFEFNRRLKEDERTSHIPVILLTAKSDMNSRLVGYETGADDYIVKPFEMEYLLCRVENLIAGRKKLRETFAKKFDIDSRELNLNSLDSKFLETIISLVEENIQDYEFGVDQIVNKMPMSRAQLYKKLKSLTNLSVNDFIQKIRLYRAAKYISERTMNVTEISYLVGYKDPSYFTKCFKKQFDCLPSEFNLKYNNCNL